MEKGKYVPVVLKVVNVADKGNYQFEVLGSAVPEKGMLPVYVRLSKDAIESAVEMFEKGPDAVLGSKNEEPEVEEPEAPALEPAAEPVKPVAEPVADDAV